MECSFCSLLRRKRVKEHFVSHLTDVWRFKAPYYTHCHVFIFIADSSGAELQEESLRNLYRHPGSSIPISLFTASYWKKNLNFLVCVKWCLLDLSHLWKETKTSGQNLVGGAVFNLGEPSVPFVTSQRGCFVFFSQLAGHSKRSEAWIVPTSLINEITSSFRISSSARCPFGFGSTQKSRLHGYLCCRVTTF